MGSRGGYYCIGRLHHVFVAEDVLKSLLDFCLDSLVFGALALSSEFGRTVLDIVEDPRNRNYRAEGVGEVDHKGVEVEDYLERPTDCDSDRPNLAEEVLREYLLGYNRRAETHEEEGRLEDEESHLQPSLGVVAEMAQGPLVVVVYFCELVVEVGLVVVDPEVH